MNQIIFLIPTVSLCNRLEDSALQHGTFVIFTTFHIVLLRSVIIIIASTYLVAVIPNPMIQNYRVPDIDYESDTGHMQLSIFRNSLVQVDSISAVLQIMIQRVQSCTLENPKKKKTKKPLGVTLIWNRGDDIKSSTIYNQLDNASIDNEIDWLQMANFTLNGARSFMMYWFHTQKQ